MRIHNIYTSNSTCILWTSQKTGIQSKYTCEHTCILLFHDYVMTMLFDNWVLKLSNNILNTTSQRKEVGIKTHVPTLNMHFTTKFGQMNTQIMHVGKKKEKTLSICQKLQEGDRDHVCLSIVTCNNINNNNNNNQL